MAVEMTFPNSDQCMSPVTTGIPVRENFLVPRWVNLKKEKINKLEGNKAMVT
jgi:hypothetical protein